MKSNLLKSLRLTLVFCVFFSVFYILILWLFALLAGPNGGKVDVALLNGKVVGGANVGQNFTGNTYFWGRPSCAGKGYEGTSSGGSNKGTNNKVYVEQVQSRIDTFLVKHPYLKRAEVPAEMVTASASGLDPDISVASALVQVKRVAEARGWSEEKVTLLVNKAIERPLWGWFGPSKIHVLKLNIALDEMSN